jgi:V-type H+-transporting ATPase subunit D
MKSKLKGAQIGHDLLKRKSEALTKYAPNYAIHVKLC